MSCGEKNLLRGDKHEYKYLEIYMVSISRLHILDAFIFFLDVKSIWKEDFQLPLSEVSSNCV